ncbi:lariat debranching enzyme, C-terminal domain-containing protein [Camillea tinctor]|nr:lariat debranching enzyme, C-terminal domain-containing protein [Camillea tinctor]
MEANTLLTGEGVRVAIEGCGHGTLDAIYDSVKRSSKARGWDGVDLVIIGGDFQAARNGADLSVMAVPAKYRQLGDYHAYYSGSKKAPYLTLFVGGNHEAAAHMAELYYGGWVAHNIYYMGAANVLRLGPLRIAGMSGIWKEHYYHTTHEERLPFRFRDVRSFYAVREEDVRKLLLLREPVDVGISHDWPLGIEQLGDVHDLLGKKPHFKSEIASNSLGNPAAAWVMDRLRPAYWFSAHLHTNFAAVKEYDPPGAPADSEEKEPAATTEDSKPNTNPDEIDLDDADDASVKSGEAAQESTPEQKGKANANPDEIDLDDAEDGIEEPKAPAPNTSAVSDELRAQLPASFAKPDNHNNNQPKPSSSLKPGQVPGQPVPSTITNQTTRFLALNKCLPGRKFLSVLPIQPLDPSNLKQYPPYASSPGKPRYKLSYDAEWLAIQRAFAPTLQIGVWGAEPPPDLGEAGYAPLLADARAWVDEHVVRAGKLRVPLNFARVAPAHRPHHDPEMVAGQPHEHTNPQTSAYCALLGVENKWWDASEEDRVARRELGPTPAQWNGGAGERAGRRGRAAGGRISGKGGKRAGRQDPGR